MNTALIIIYGLTFINLFVIAKQGTKEKDGVIKLLTAMTMSLLMLVLIWWALDWKFI